MIVHAAQPQPTRVHVNDIAAKLPPCRDHRPLLIDSGGAAFVNAVGEVDQDVFRVHITQKRTPVAALNSLFCAE